MEYVDGHVVRDVEGAEAALDVRVRDAVGRSVADALAALHTVDVDAVGLGGFARREGYISRQLERWHRQFDATQVDGLRRMTEIDDVYELLSSRIPEQGPAAIVHGDYRLDNTVVDGGGTVLAVLDWELCTLGDPLADLGTLIAFWAEPNDHLGPLESAPTKAPGFPSRADMIARYSERSGRDVAGVDFYVAFGYWRISCALQGVINRYLAGVGSGDRSSTPDEMAQRAQGTATLAAQAAARL
jgi:aminoglycoside phosphotransferase (APT) family kinase protein